MTILAEKGRAGKSQQITCHELVGQSACGILNCPSLDQPRDAIGRRLQGQGYYSQLKSELRYILHFASLPTRTARLIRHNDVQNATHAP